MSKYEINKTFGGVEVVLKQPPEDEDGDDKKDD